MVGEGKGGCNKQEDIVLDGKKYQIEMTLPEIGFGYTDANNPLNFELLRYLNYTSVAPIFYKHTQKPLLYGDYDRDRNWFWSHSPDYYYNSAWAFNSVTGEIDLGYRNNYENSVRCVGR